MKFVTNLIMLIIAVIALYLMWQYIQKNNMHQETTVATTIDPKTGAVSVQENTKKPCLNLPVIGNCP